MVKNVFDHINNIQKIKGEYLGDNHWSTWLVMKVLSMNKDNIELIDILQKNFRVGTYIPNKVMYNCLREVINTPRYFNPYIKNQNKKIYQEDELEIIARLYEVSQREAKEIIDDMDKDELETIKQQYATK